MTLKSLEYKTIHTFSLNFTYGRIMSARTRHSYTLLYTSKVGESYQLHFPLYPFMPYGTSHPYRLDESISKLHVKDIGHSFSISFKLKKKITQYANNVEPDQTPRSERGV